MPLDRRHLILALGGAVLAPDTVAGQTAPGDDPMALFRAIPGLKLEGDEQVAMLMYPGFTALDLVGPYHFLGGMLGAKVHLVTNQSDLRPVPSDLGLAIQPTSTMADCPSELTVLFAPGGTDGTIAAARDPATVAFMHDRGERATYVTSVCTGALILGVCGFLKGRRATSHWAARDLLGAFGATPVNKRVVVDGNVITGAGVTSGMDFGIALAQTLRGRPHAEAQMLTAEYAPEPPLTGGTVERTPVEVLRPTEALFSGFRDAARTLRPLY